MTIRVCGCHEQRSHWFCLVCSLGGAIDHAILALLRSERTTYGARVGIRGNWGFVGMDFVIAVWGYVLYRQLGPRSNGLSR